MTPATLTMNASQHEMLLSHLFPGDGNEAAAIGLCSRREGSNQTRLLLMEIHPIAYADCETRTPVQLSWSTDLLVPLLDRADRDNLSVVKFHSHPTGFPDFSEVDNRSDKALFASVSDWVTADVPHASVLMLPGGKMLGRTFDQEMGFVTLRRIMVVGDDIQIWHDPAAIAERMVSAVSSGRATKAFGASMTAELQCLTAGVVGCSGTGSIALELLARLRFGRIVAIDHERIKAKNANRIVNATANDIRKGAFKVDVVVRAINDMGLGTDAVGIAKNIVNDAAAVRALAECDVVFGCVDSEEARLVINRIATFYLIPYIDIGVRLDADSLDGSIEEIVAAVHYLQPGRSSLVSRGAISLERVRAEALLRENPELYAELRRRKYIVGAEEEEPAVASVNAIASAHGVQEFLARRYGFRDSPNGEYASVRLSLAGMMYDFESEGEVDMRLRRYVGVGDVTPLLNMIAFSRRNAE